MLCSTVLTEKVTAARAQCVPRSSQLASSAYAVADFRVFAEQTIYSGIW